MGCLYEAIRDQVKKELGLCEKLFEADAQLGGMAGSPGRGLRRSRAPLFGRFCCSTPPPIRFFGGILYCSNPSHLNFDDQMACHILGLPGKKFWERLFGHQNLGPIRISGTSSGFTF